MEGTFLDVSQEPAEIPYEGPAHPLRGAISEHPEAGNLDGAMEMIVA